MFVGKDFVLKHIRVKHAEKVEEFKNKVGCCCRCCSRMTQLVPILGALLSALSEFV